MRLRCLGVEMGVEVGVFCAVRRAGGKRKGVGRFFAGVGGRACTDVRGILASGMYHVIEIFMSTGGSRDENKWILSLPLLMG